MNTFVYPSGVGMNGPVQKLPTFDKRRPGAGTRATANPRATPRMASASFDGIMQLQRTALEIEIEKHGAAALDEHKAQKQGRSTEEDAGD